MQNKYTRKDLRKPIVPIGPSIAYIPLTKGYFALVDSGDIELLSGRNWHAFVCAKGTYARRRLGPNTFVFMHNFLMPPPDGKTIDHKERNPLDNRRSQLRYATPLQQVLNRNLNSNNRSGYAGVFWCRINRKWLAYITVDRQRTRLGYFADKQSAIDARRAGELRHFPQDCHIFCDPVGSLQSQPRTT